MQIFTPLYRKMLRWSRHRHAAGYLVAVSFMEAWIFPLPTAVMLAPMVLANRRRAWRLACLATGASVLGGVFGYFIGYFFFEQVGKPILDFYHAAQQFDVMQQWFAQYGVWLVLLAGVTPIPYKIFTLASGVLGLPIGWFVLASIAGRAAQFFMVAGLLWWGGEKIQQVLEKWLEASGWGLVAVAVGGYLWWR